MSMIFKKWLIGACLGLNLSVSFAQNAEKIGYQANILLGRKHYKLLRGNVVFRHQNATMYCDSAKFFQKSQYLEAFGHVKLIDQSGTMYSDILYYTGSNRYVQLRQNVRYISQQGVLLTDSLDYDINDRTGFFKGSGILQQGEQTIESEQGFYAEQQGTSRFIGQVKVRDSLYTLETDTLHYNMRTETADIYGYTHVIFSDTIHIWSKHGGYVEVKPERYVFYQAFLQNSQYKVWGDTLSLSNQDEVYEASGNVAVEFQDSLRLYGSKGRYLQQTGYMQLHGDAVATRIFPEDTIYIQSDTLKILEDSVGRASELYAFYHVRIFSKYMLGRCDSMHYTIEDTVIYLRKDPILWHEDTQITSESLDLYLDQQVLSKLHFQNKALAISLDSLLYFNQVKGREMEMLFVDNHIDRLYVKGNAESVYHILEGDTLLSGMNRIVAGEMTMFFKDQSLHNALFTQNPEGTYYRPSDISEKNSRLEHFTWRIDEKPNRDSLLNYIDTYLQHIFIPADTSAFVPTSSY